RHGGEGLLERTVPDGRARRSAGRGVGIAGLRLLTRPVRQPLPPQTGRASTGVCCSGRAPETVLSSGLLAKGGGTVRETMAPLRGSMGSEPFSSRSTHPG